MITALCRTRSVRADSNGPSIRSLATDWKCLALCPSICRISALAAAHFLDGMGTTDLPRCTAYALSGRARTSVVDGPRLQLHVRKPLHSRRNPTDSDPYVR